MVRDMIAELNEMADGIRDALKRLRPIKITASHTPRVPFAGANARCFDCGANTTLEIVGEDVVPQQCPKCGCGAFEVLACWRGLRDANGCGGYRDQSQDH